MTKKHEDMGTTRSELIRLSESLLVGPLKGEERLESAPADTYLTGILWPRGASVGGADDDGGLEAAGSEDGAGEAAIPGYRAVRPCSIGITFAVKTGTTVFVSLGRTSRYEPTESASASVAAEVSSSGARAVTGAADGSKPAGKSVAAAKPTKREWVRRELGYSLTLKPENESSAGKIRLFAAADGQEIRDDRLSIHVRRRVRTDQQVFTLTLINEEFDSDESGPRDARCLFQTEMIVTVDDSEASGIVPRPLPPPDASDEDALVNALLYRDVREFAVGHGIAATWNSEQTRVVREVRTSWLPQQIVRGTSTDGHPLLAEFRSIHPTALSAAYLSDEGARDRTTAALDLFAVSYGQWINEVLERRCAEFDGHLRHAAESNLQRCIRTLNRIQTGVEMLRTDSNAWIAFALANAAMDRQSKFSSKGKSAGPLIWRPFQLAFMLLVLPGIVDAELEDRECMDLLWFPTGGGKTEAYLALTAFQIFHRRLIDESRSRTGGVDVLMRYTLRLLTVQQFQRAAALITACDLIRQEDRRLGCARISLGLYVGGEATPNSMEDARQAIILEQAGQTPKSSPRQLLKCPVCGSELHASAYRADPRKPVVDIVCGAADCETAGRPLPVQTVDEAIYDAPPSLLIGTIDKFAQIPRRFDIRRIFGLDDGAAPGLIIQDELHLISGPLGSMAGLYETIVDMLCTRDGVRPKVIGSTATIGHAESQVRSLFDRAVLQFPPPGFDASDSFFAVRDESGPNRSYMGIPTTGRSPKFALQAVVAALLQSASALLESGSSNEEAIDPYWTCVAYFNSLRELGGAYVLMQDDVPRQMQFLAGRLESALRRLEHPSVELSSRRSSRELPELLNAISGTLPLFRADPFEHEEPKDMVLASNMISVGVDVPRLGLMVVNGQPKSTAEYIQASSRVGRGIPGLVVTLYNTGRPRDLSHFEHFMSYHGALYRSVEATSVTPWAARARDKALHAVVASLVRHLVPGLQDDDGAGRFDAEDPKVAEILDVIRRRVTAASDSDEADETAEDLAAIVEAWSRRSDEAQSSGKKLRYWIKKAPFGKTTPHLMCSAEDAAPGSSPAWATPNTMREVEPSTAFVLKTI